jgi:copper ion binding protein
MKLLVNFVLIIVLSLSLVSVVSAGEKKTVDLKIKGMTCNGCVSAVESHLKEVKGVDEVKVALASNSAMVTYDQEKVKDKDLKGAVKKAGFEVTAVKAAEKNIDKKAEKSTACCGSSGACGAAAEKKGDI